MDIEKLWGLVDNWRLWAVCGIAFGLGAIGGVIRALTADPPPDPPPRGTVDAKLAAARLFFVGGIAAVAVMYVTLPDSAMALIGGSLVAGYAGKAILDALESRAKLAAANARADENRRLALRAFDAPPRARGLVLPASDRLALLAAASDDAEAAAVPMEHAVKVVPYTPPAASVIEVVPTIGNGQLGAWTVFLDGVIKASGTGPKPVALGQGSTLAGKKLEVSATISDVQGAHNRLSLRVTLTGRPDPIDLEREVAAGNRGQFSIVVPFGAA